MIWHLAEGFVAGSVVTNLMWWRVSLRMTKKHDKALLKVLQTPTGYIKQVGKVKR